MRPAARRYGYSAVALFLLVAGGVPSCGDGILEFGDDWTLLVSAVTTGEDLDEDGYIVVTDEGYPRALLEPSGRAALKVEDGDHMLELTELAENCTAQSDNPVAVTTTRGKVVSVSFRVHCGAMGNR